MNLAEAIELANKQDNDKTPYSFRCNTKTLEQLKQYSTINNVRLPSLLNVILSDWCNKHIKGNITETEYISADILDRIKFLEDELDIYQKQLNKLSKQIHSIKNECNRELIKEREIRSWEND